MKKERKGKEKTSGKRRRERRFITGMLAPMCTMFVCFGLFPIAYSLYLSVLNWKLNVKRDIAFVGLDNYVKAFQDKVFLQSFPKTAYFVALLIIGSLLIGLLFAIVVNSKHIRFKSWWILMGLLPWAIPKVVGGLMFNWIFDGNYGILNYVLNKLGVFQSYQWWFTKNAWISLTLCGIVSVWRNAPFVGLMLYAGMQSIGREQYEAAEIDGASGLQSFFHITLPGLRNVLMTTMILITTWALKTYDTIATMTQGGPGTDTTITYLYIYQQAFSYSNISYASALGWLFALLIGLFIVLYVRTLGRDNTV